MSKDRGFIPDSPEDILYFVIGIMVAVPLVFMNFQTVSEIYNKFAASEGQEYTGGEVIVPQKYLERIADDYAHKRFEAAYCFVLDGNRIKSLFSADIRTASERDVIFMCPSYSDGAVHTHNLGYPEPSSTDKNTFLSSSYDLMCVYSGSLRCWEKKDGRLSPVKVIKEAGS